MFAAGEVTGGLHGADRMGGNALTEAALFGIEAGRQMADFATGKECAVSEDAEITFKNPVLSMFKNDKFYLPPTLKEKDIYELRDELRNLYWNGLNPIRSEKSLANALNELEQFRKKILPPESDNEEFTFNDGKIDEIKEIITLEMSSSLLELCLKSADLRKETRGGHFRKDFVKKDDNYNKNIFWQQGKVFFRDSS
ncbi:8-methylmenaquinol:fumarate reductase flavoprotein subunit [Natranaerofaba carboxydovora]|nr:8-methylmenaquinol:fumarate reductase flavoprotein subunit [Natranaerofaba carboxydovora]